MGGEEKEVTYNNKPVATRGDGLHLVPSQETERHKATDAPEIWPADSVVDRLGMWWDEISADPYFWRTLAWCSVFACFIAALVVTW